MDAAEERKKRLAAIRAAAEEMPAAESSASAGAEPTEDDVQVRFRNYRPRDKRLQDNVIESSRAPDIEAMIRSGDARADAERHALGEQPQPSNAAEEAIANIAPKKANWDLKREVGKKLDRLEARTQKAIYELLQEKIQREGGADLSSAVDAAG